MKTIIAIVTLMLAVSPLRAQTPESLKPLELNSVSLQAVRAVPIPDAKLSPVPAEPGTRDSWKHVRLYAADGTLIEVDYSVVHLVDSVMAAPVWFNVTNKTFGGSRNIRLVFINYYEGGISPGQAQETRQIDLTYAGGNRYTGQLQKVLLSHSHIGYGYNSRQEAAVVVDGKWLTTPGDSHNFGFKMTWY